jgi:hypothetical protein
MNKMMSLSARREMVFGVNDAYGRASKSEKLKYWMGLLLQLDMKENILFCCYQRKFSFLQTSANANGQEDKYMMNNLFMYFEVA